MVKGVGMWSSLAPNMASPRLCAHALLPSAGKQERLRPARLGASPAAANTLPSSQTAAGAAWRQDVPLTSSSFTVLVSALLGWALVLVVSRALLIAFGFDPWLFTLIQMLTGGLFLIAIAGRGPAVGDALRNPWTWVYGVLRIVSAALFTAALVHVSTANAAFLAISSVPLSAVLLWLALSRRPLRQELPGHALIVGGLVLLGFSLEDGWHNPAIWLMAGSEICVVATTTIAELHPLNRTDDMRQRASLTGVMLLASALVMLAAAIGLAFAAAWLPGLQMLAPVSLPWLADPALALDPLLWTLAATVGIALRGPSMFFSLKAIYLVRTANYLSAMATLPFICMLLESLAHAAGWLPAVSLTNLATAFGLLMTLGSLAVLWGRSRAARAAGRVSTT